MIKGRPDQGKFFDFNPEMVYVTEIGELIEMVGMDRADRYMWALWLVYHPESSLFEKKLEDKLGWVVKNYLKEDSFKWSVVDEVMMIFSQVAMTKEEQMYHDAVVLYDESMAQARHLMPKDKTAFIKSLPAAASVIKELRKEYMQIKDESKTARTSGDTQSGWGSRKKGS